jgi:hypothetical protein
MVLGSAFFGSRAIHALMNKYALETHHFGCWLAALAVMYTFVLLADGFYYYDCCSNYSYNVIAEAALWSIPSSLPVNKGVKYELQRMKAYPAEYIDKLASLNVGGFYFILIVFKIVFLCHASWTALRLADRFHFGVFGLGANYSIQGWQQRLKLREEYSQVAGNTLDMALATAMDVDWDKDEFQLRRPLRGGIARQWYRGAAQGQTARAYDGFSDDRQNVLL